jgi:hypothetical protein
MWRQCILKCPECGKRGITYSSGKGRGKLPRKSLLIGMSLAEKVAEMSERRIESEGHTWDLECRYCGFKKKILYRELLALEHADPVYMRKRQERFEHEFQYD